MDEMLIEPEPNALARERRGKRCGIHLLRQKVVLRVRF
jgi:hypothetical protein